MSLLSPELQRLVGGLRFQPRRSFRGVNRGERAVAQRGTSIEFRDFREYGEGDDLRHLDWNALARLDTALTKTYRDEQDLLIGLWLDGSASMRFGAPEKLSLARRLAASLGWTALMGGERVHGGTLGQPHRSYRGRGQSTLLLQALASEGASLPKGGLCEQIRLGQRALPRNGVIVLLTDGLDPEFPRALGMLGQGGNEVWLLQILAPEEMEPELEGDLLLIDSEGRGSHEVTANAAVLAEYQRNLAGHLEACQQAVVRGGGRYLQVVADQDPVAVMKDHLIRERWLA